MNRLALFGLLAGSLMCHNKYEVESWKMPSKPKSKDSKSPVHSVIIVYGTYPCNSTGLTYNDSYKIYCSEEVADQIMRGEIHSFVDAYGKKYNLDKYQTLQHIVE